MRTRAVSPEPCGLVQVVCVHWNKSARGGQAARDRNAVPQAFAVSAALLAGGRLCVDVSHWGDRNAFAVPLSSGSRQLALSAGFAFRCVRVMPRPEGLEVRCQYDQAAGGAPDRWHFNWSIRDGRLLGQSLVVSPDRWVRVCWNGRFPCQDTGDWHYEQTTVNVAWFVGEPDERVFLDRAPAQELRLLADLW